MKRVLVYSHDTYGLGNIRRMLAICEHVCAVHDDVSILIVSGSPMLHAFRLSPRLDYVKLPCLARTIEGSYEVKSLGLGYDATLAMRREILSSTVSSFRPHLILVDKKPFGVDEELRPALEAAHASFAPPAMVLLLRDILDAPETTAAIWEKNGYYAAIERYFDSVLVLGSAEIFDPVSAYRFPGSVADLVDFCGYLARPPGATSRRAMRARLGVHNDQSLVLVTAGGGADGAHLTDCFLETVPGLAKDSFCSVVIAGPELPTEARARLHSSADLHSELTVVDFTNDMASHIGAADVVVCMAGYNTMCEVLSARCAVVAIPRVRPVQEQLMRAELFDARGLLDSLHPGLLTPVELRSRIETAAYRPRLSPVTLDMDGLERVEKHLAGLIGDV